MRFKSLRSAALALGIFMLAATVQGPGVARAQDSQGLDVTGPIRPTTDWRLLDSLRPNRMFLQVGSGSNERAANAGLIWEHAMPWRVGNAHVTVNTELNIGRWWTQGDFHSSSVNTQFGVTPSLRLTSSGPMGYFVEAGIGANVVAPLYRNGDKRFSTAFNFGDHLSAGMRPWGPDKSEISLRLEHFSNGGIKEPNPGQNHIQVRWTVPI